MVLNEPWIKVLHTATTEKEAKLLSDELIKQGMGIVATLPPQGPFTKYRIGIFDESKVSMFDEINQASGMDLIQCNSCNKQENENNLFKCRNCGFIECEECGMNRLYNGQIPIIHECGRDNFEMLADIGKCTNCGEPMGFKSAPQKVRIRMMAKIRLSSMQMMTLGLLGCFFAEKQFVDMEIMKISNSTEFLFEKLKQSHDNPSEWLKTFKSIKSNFLRSGWSTSYILEVLDPFLSKVGKIPYEEISEKLRIVFPEFTLKGFIFSIICDIIDNKLTESQYNQHLTQVEQYMNDPKSPYYSNREKNIVLELQAFGNFIQDPNSIDTYAPLIEGLMLIDDMANIINRSESQLKCDIEPTVPELIVTPEAKDEITPTMIVPLDYSNAMNIIPSGQEIRYSTLCSASLYDGQQSYSFTSHVLVSDGGIAISIPPKLIHSDLQLAIIKSGTPNMESALFFTWYDGWLEFTDDSFHVRTIVQGFLREISLTVNSNPAVESAEEARQRIKQFYINFKKKQEQLKKELDNRLKEELQKNGDLSFEEFNQNYPELYTPSGYFGSRKETILREKFDELVNEQLTINVDLTFEGFISEFPNKYFTSSGFESRKKEFYKKNKKFVKTQKKQKKK